MFLSFSILAKTVKILNYITSLFFQTSCVLCLSDASSDFPTAGLSQPYFTPIIFLHDLQSDFKWFFSLLNAHVYSKKKKENGKWNDKEKQSQL